MKINEIVGIDNKSAKLLEKEGISNVEDLLPLTASKIKKLSEKTGIDAKLIDTWQEHADLMRINGVTPKYAYALNSIGIDSVKEFGLRNPKNTLEKLQELDKSKLKLVGTLPKLQDIENWIKEAKKLKGDEEVTAKKKAPKKAPKITPQEEKPSKKEEEDYGPDYWNNKYQKVPIIYTGRALRGKSYNQQIDADVKSFIKNNDEILKHVIEQAQLKKGSYNVTALSVQKFVCDFLKYTYDEETSDCPEFWQFPFESVQSGIGDCEDGAILISSLLINCGIPSYRVKVCGGGVLPDPVTAPSDTELGGHAWTLYLADRSDTERGLEWVILDWCYAQDPEVSVEKKPLAKNGGQFNGYKETWFTFNDEYSWGEGSFEITKGRMSEKRTAKKDDVLITLKDLVRNIAQEQMENVLKKYNIRIE